MREAWVWSLGQEDPLEKKMATHSSVLAWRIPGAEEPGRLQSIGWQTAGHDWATFTFSEIWVGNISGLQILEGLFMARIFKYVLFWPGGFTRMTMWNLWRKTFRFRRPFLWSSFYKDRNNWPHGFLIFTISEVFQIQSGKTHVWELVQKLTVCLKGELNTL